MFPTTKELTYSVKSKAIVDCIYIIYVYVHTRTYMHFSKVQGFKNHTKVQHYFDPLNT